jgi:hypothetical protein
MKSGSFGNLGCRQEFFTKPGGTIDVTDNYSVVLALPGFFAGLQSLQSWTSWPFFFSHLAFVNLLHLPFMQQLIFGSFLVSFWAMASGAAATNAISVKTSANFFILGLLIQRRSSRHPIHTFIWGVDHASYFSTFAGCKAFSAGTSDFFYLKRTRIYLLNQ